METPVIDWQQEFLELSEKYQQAERDVIRLDIRVEYYKAENERLKQELARYTATIESTCKECGRPFTQKKIGRPGKYCSNACKTKASRIRKLFKRPVENSLVTNHFVTSE